MRLSRNRLVSAIARTYISIIRGTPLLVQLFVIFYGLPSVGITISPWPSAIIAFSLNVGGYAAEVIRAAILSVPKGQWEAGHTIGMSRRQTLVRIILPRPPGLSPAAVQHFHPRGQGHLAGFPDPRHRTIPPGAAVAAFSQEFMLLYLEAAVIYWVICLILAGGQSALEKRLDRYVAH